MRSGLLKAERVRRGWTQAKVAEAVGVDAKTVGRWERGKALPYPYYREQLCLLFGRTAQQLGLSSVNEDDLLEPADRLDVQVQASFLIDPTIPQFLENVTSLVGRYDLLMEVKERLLAGENVALTAVDSLPGVGKTALAAVLATDQQIRDHFYDGILWAGLGPRSNVLGHLMRWGSLLGVVPSQVENIRSPESWSQALRAVIGSRRLLLIINDAWTVEDALCLQVGGRACTHMLTTRLSEVALAFDQEGSITVPQLEEADGMALLSRFVPELIEQDPTGAHALVQALGGLPLSLTLIGSYLACQTFPAQSHPLQTTLRLLDEAEECLRGSMSGIPEEGAASLGEMMPLSLYAAIALCDHLLSPQAHAALCALASFLSKSESFSEEVALVVTQQPIEILDDLCDAGLLEVWEPGQYLLHQTVADYICTHDNVSADQTREVSFLLEDDVNIHKLNVGALQHSISSYFIPQNSFFRRSGLPPFMSFNCPFARNLLILSILLLIVLIIIAILPVFTKYNATITPSPALRGVCYQAHVQNLSWQSQVCDGAMAGTTGHSLRLEAIKINLVNAPQGSHICYQAHVQNLGWQNQVCDGAMAGTTGFSLRLEAIKINLVNAPQGSHICYQARVQNIGWQSQVCDGAMAGTTGHSLRLEAIKIVVSH